MSATPQFRPFDPKSDMPAMARLWLETAWIDSDTDAKVLDQFVERCTGTVAVARGEVEAAALCRMGEIRYERRDLPLAEVATVNVGLPWRGLGLGGRVCAEAVALGVRQGAAVSALGMFDQGYYDKLGFGTGSATRYSNVDPRLLDVPRLTRAPVRLSEADSDRVAQCRARRYRAHGSANFPEDPGAAASEIGLQPKSFGLGFEGDDGTLTHHLWVKPKGEEGPHKIVWMAYQNGEQLLELLSVIASWRDQVLSVRLEESPLLCLQDVMVRPFRHASQTHKGKHDQATSTIAWWQARITDLAACIAAVSLPGSPLTFQLRLTDPIGRYLPDDAPWRGEGGDWLISLGPTSSAKRGSDPSLPVLEASINAFSRLWLGVLPASTLQVADDLRAPASLIEALDDRWRVREPCLDWDL